MGQPLSQVLFCATFLFAYTVQAIAGFAGKVFVMPVGVHLFGMGFSVSVLNALGFFSCGMLALMNIRSVDWREFGRIIGVMVVFLFVGMWLNSVIPLPVLMKIFGAVVVAIGLKFLLRPHQKFMPSWVLFLVLALAGLIQGMFVSGGPFLVVYAMQRIKDKDAFRSTLSLVWAVLNFLYAALAFSQGHFTGDVWLMIAVCIPLSLMATFLGNRISKRISRDAFMKLTYVMLVAVGVLLVLT